MDSLQAAIGDYQAFLDTMLSEVRKAGFDLEDFIQMDHMCYRVATDENYANKKAELDRIATLLHETTVNGRLIATYRLRTPIIVQGWRIDTLELPAPKPGTHMKEGLEHVEFVIYDDIPTFLGKYSDKTFNLQSAERGINPEVGYKLANGYGVKFHLLNLQTVVYLEKKLGITNVTSAPQA